MIAFSQLFNLARAFNVLASSEVINIFVTTTINTKFLVYRCSPAIKKVVTAF